jgi:hypothetical protein
MKRSASRTRAEEAVAPPGRKSVEGGSAEEASDRTWLRNRISMWMRNRILEIYRRKRIYTEMRAKRKCNQDDPGSDGTCRRCNTSFWPQEYLILTVMAAATLIISDTTVSVVIRPLVANCDLCAINAMLTTGECRLGCPCRSTSSGSASRPPKTKDPVFPAIRNRR